MFLSVLGTAFSVSGCDAAAEAQAAPPPPPSVSVAPVVRHRVNDVEEFSGQIEASDYVELRPRIAGTIDTVHFVDGAMVRKGELLFTVDPRPFEAELARAQSLLAGARAKSDLAQQELSRAAALLDRQAASREEVDQLSASARTSRADIQSAEAAVRVASLNLGFTRVRAPIAGKVSRANITAGNLVDEHSVLTSIAGVERVYAYFDGSERTFLLIKSMASDAKAPRISLALANEDDYVHEGRLDFVDNRLNPRTGAVRMRASFDNAKGQFTPGLAARIRMQSPTAYDAVMVADRAIGTDQSKRFVFVVGADGKPEVREVRPGALFGGMRVVRGKLEPGENVVVDGLQRIQPGMSVTPQVLQVDAHGMPVAPPAGQGAAPAGKG